MSTVYKGGTVFTAEGPGNSGPLIREAFAVQDGKFLAVGTLEAVRAAAGAGAAEVDLGGKFVAPGIIDAHAHLPMFGKALAKVPLRDCQTLSQIQERLVAARQQNVEAPRVLGVGWLFDSVEGEPSAAMLDAVLPDVPVYLDANDFHSMWVNSAALREMGITRDTPDPVGGRVARDKNGAATGMLYEMAAIEYGWSFLDSTYTHEEVIHALDLAFAAYLVAGVTGATEMALDGAEVRGLQAIVERDGCLPFPVTAHWLLMPSTDPAENLKSVQVAVAVREELAHNAAVAPWLRVTGVKFILDGVIDACTATMRAPYANGSNAAPIWSPELLLPTAAATDHAGLAIAMHAIGDRTSEIALDAVEYCVAQNGKRARRHRVEHLESVADTTIERLAELEVVASMQPVHCDPAVLPNWKAMLGDERAELGFPWHKFRHAGVHMALGTDAPTAPHEPLPNLYIALTGASVLAPDLDPYHPERAFTPAEALTALTAGAAYAGGLENEVGRIEAGLDATFIVLDINPLETEPRALLDARVLRTVVRGRQLQEQK